MRMSEIRRRLKRKTDVWIDEKRLHIELFPAYLEIWPAHAHTKLRVDYETLWEQACKLDAHVRTPGLGQPPVDDRQESFDFDQSLA